MSRLGNAEQFYLSLIKVPEYRFRIEYMLLKVTLTLYIWLNFFYLFEKLTYRGIRPSYSDRLSDLTFLDLSTKMSESMKRALHTMVRNDILHVLRLTITWFKNNAM